jgi:excinuclease UvrABC nuclease subunit
MSGDALRDVRKPGVYVLMRAQTVLYVGMGKRIMGRLAGGQHAQEDKAIAECDAVLLYPCVSATAAEALETLLIGRLQPRFNRRKRNVKHIAEEMTAEIMIDAEREGIQIAAETDKRVRPKSWVSEQRERIAA